MTARDADGDTATLEFKWSIEDPMPDFGQASLPDKAWTHNAAISRFTAPAASGGNSPVRYAASGLPDGVTMSSLRRFSGAPNATGSGTATVTARDADGDTDALTFDWTVRQQDLKPTFGASSVSARSWTQNSAIAAFTVPAATGGDAPLSYSATGLPAGVSMNASRSVSGTPTASGMGTATVTVSDKDGDTDTLSFGWTVASPNRTPSFDGVTVAAKSWAPNRAIAAFTVPAASGGDGTVTYAAAGLPGGVSMSSLRVVSGTPTAAGSGTATVTARDRDGDTDSVSFRWSVAADLKPSFGTASVGMQAWTANQSITAFTVPAASGGDGTVTYTAVGLPYGVSMSSARRISGTPLFASSGTATVTARDADGDTDTLSFAWTVAATDLMPTYSSASVAQPSWARNQAIVGFTVPAASGGNAPLRYSASGLPAGIAMTTARALAGTPTSVGTGTATVTATDADGDTATFAFDWAVVTDDLAPTFGSATVQTQTWATDKAIAAFTAPAASGGNAPVVHGVNGLPAGVVMLDSMRVEGTPTAAGSGTATVAARDADGDIVKLSFTWTVSADSAPSFGTSTVSSQSWTAGQAITSLTVPSATGGNGALSYGAMGLPSGIALSPSLRLSGTPRKTGSGTATVTARDADGDTDTVSVAWTVGSPDSADTGAVLSTAANPTASGDYTVAGNYTGTRTYRSWRLTESSARGDAWSYSVSGATFSQSIVGRTNGVYTYGLIGCNIRIVGIDGEPQPVEICQPVGNSLRVTVNGPAPDSVGTQLGYTFQARVNDANPANATAIFIDRTSSATGAGVFRDIVLQKNGNAFQLVAPSSATGPSPSSWPTTAAVDLVLNDINLDGFVDILVRGLDEAIAGALDQIVYAPGRTGGTRGALRAVDSTLTNFLSEVGSWTRNPAYFDNAMESVSVVRYRLARVCWEDEVVSENLERYCGWVRRPYTITVTRPSNSSPEAREFAGQFSAMNGKINPDVTLGSQSARNLSGILEDMLGAEVLNGDLKTGCIGSFSYDSRSDISCNNPRQVGRIVLAQIDIIRAITCGGGNTCPDKDSDGVTDLGEYRNLTSSEREIAQENGIDLGDVEDDVNQNGIIDEWEKVRIYREDDDQDRWYATRPDRIHVPSAKPGQPESADGVFKEEFTSVEDLAILLHELMHVTQFEGLVHAIVAGNEPKDYWYRDENGNLELNADNSTKSFEHFTTQQQAEIIADRFRLCRGSDAGIDRNSTDEKTMSGMYDELNSIPGILESTTTCVS